VTIPAPIITAPIGYDSIGGRTACGELNYGRWIARAILAGYGEAGHWEAFEGLGTWGGRSQQGVNYVWAAGSKSCRLNRYREAGFNQVRSKGNS
jgi:hypothetical protein